LLQEAARVAHKNVSEFLLDAGITAANQTLADRARFELGAEQWKAFQAALCPGQSKVEQCADLCVLPQWGGGWLLQPCCWQFAPRHRCAAGVAASTKIYIAWETSSVTHGTPRRFLGIDRFRIVDGMAVEEHIVFDSAVLTPEGRPGIDH
jgi:hypothetical protein